MRDHHSVAALTRSRAAGSVWRGRHPPDPRSPGAKHDVATPVLGRLYRPGFCPAGQGRNGRRISGCGHPTAWPAFATVGGYRDCERTDGRVSAVDPGGLPGDLSAHDICWQIGPAHRLARHLDTFGADFDRDVDRDRGFGGGGGQIAVAANWFALHPDLVRMEHGRDFVPRIAELVRDNRHLGLGNAGKLGWQMQDLNAAGVAGNAAAATGEKGGRLLIMRHVRSWRCWVGCIAWLYHGWTLRPIRMPFHEGGAGHHNDPRFAQLWAGCSGSE